MDQNIDSFAGSQLPDPAFRARQEETPQVQAQARNRDSNPYYPRYSKTATEVLRDSLDIRTFYAAKDPFSRISLEYQSRYPFPGYRTQSFNSPSQPEVSSDGNLTPARSDLCPACRWGGCDHDEQSYQSDSITTAFRTGDVEQTEQSTNERPLQSSQQDTSDTKSSTEETHHTTTTRDQTLSQPDQEDLIDATATGDEDGISTTNRDQSSSQTNLQGSLQETPATVHQEYLDITVDQGIPEEPTSESEGQIVDIPYTGFSAKTFEEAQIARTEANESQDLGPNALVVLGIQDLYQQVRRTLLNGSQIQRIEKGLDSALRAVRTPHASPKIHREYQESRLLPETPITFNDRMSDSTTQTEGDSVGNAETAHLHRKLHTMCEAVAELAEELKKRRSENAHLQTLAAAKLKSTEESLTNANKSIERLEGEKRSVENARNVSLNDAAGAKQSLAELQICVEEFLSDVETDVDKLMATDLRSHWSHRKPKWLEEPNVFDSRSECDDSDTWNENGHSRADEANHSFNKPVTTTRPDAIHSHHRVSKADRDWDSRPQSGSKPTKEEYDAMCLEAEDKFLQVRAIGVKLTEFRRLVEMREELIEERVSTVNDDCDAKDLRRLCGLASVIDSQILRIVQECVFKDKAEGTECIRGVQIFELFRRVVSTRWESYNLSKSGEFHLPIGQSKLCIAADRQVIELVESHIKEVKVTALAIMRKVRIAMRSRNRKDRKERKELALEMALKKKRSFANRSRSSDLSETERLHALLAQDCDTDRPTNQEFDTTKSTTAFPFAEDSNNLATFHHGTDQASSSQEHLMPTMTHDRQNEWKLETFPNVIQNSLSTSTELWEPSQSVSMDPYYGTTEPRDLSQHPLSIEDVLEDTGVSARDKILSEREVLWERILGNRAARAARAKEEEELQETEEVARMSFQENQIEEDQDSFYGNGLDEEGSSVANYEETEQWEEVEADSADGKEFECLSEGDFEEVHARIP